MNNSFGKVLVVFVTAFSLGFAAFAMSLVTGGPNWKKEAESKDFTDDFVLTVTAGDKKTYTVKSRQTDQGVGPQGSTLLPEVIVAARKKQAEDAKAEQNRLAAEVARLKPIINEFKQLIPEDQAGLAARGVAMDKTLSRINEQIQAASADFTAKSAVIKQVQETIKERRDEGFRLKNQLELLRTDLFVAKVQQQALEDELVRVEENLKRLERREQQLKKQIEPYADEDGK
jgi:hypothetical protein